MRLMVTPPDGVGPEQAARIADLLTQRMEALHIELQRRIVEGKLSGQVLKERTGNLRRSIIERTVSTGSRITSTVSTNAVYAKIHEYGGVITPRTAAALVFEIDGHRIATQKVTIPPRPYMVPTFAEMRQEIIEGLESAVAEGLAS